MLLAEQQKGHTAIIK